MVTIPGFVGLMNSDVTVAGKHLFVDARAQKRYWHQIALDARYSDRLHDTNLFGLQPEYTRSLVE
jgi:hypothetical protein